MDTTFLLKIMIPDLGEVDYTPYFELDKSFRIFNGRKVVHQLGLTSMNILQEFVEKRKKRKVTKYVGGSSHPGTIATKTM